MHAAFQWNEQTKSQKLAVVYSNYVVHRQQEPTTGHNENSLGSTKSGTYILT